MSRVIRRYALASAAAALVFSQAAYAAPAARLQPVDPLIALSALGTPQSRAAVTATGATAAATAAQYQPPPPGWPANQYPPRSPYYQDPGAWAYIPFLLGLIAIIALHLTDDDDDDRRPVSP